MWRRSCGRFSKPAPCICQDEDQRIEARNSPTRQIKEKVEFIGCENPRWLDSDRRRRSTSRPSPPPFLDSVGRDQALATCVSKHLTKNIERHVDALRRSGREEAEYAPPLDRASQGNAAGLRRVLRRYAHSPNGLRDYAVGAEG